MWEFPLLDMLASAWCRPPFSFKSFRCTCSSSSWWFHFAFPAEWWCRTCGVLPASSTDRAVEQAPSVCWIESAHFLCSSSPPSVLSQHCRGQGTDFLRNQNGKSKRNTISPYLKALPLNQGWYLWIFLPRDLQLGVVLEFFTTSLYSELPEDSLSQLAVRKRAAVHVYYIINMVAPQGEKSGHLVEPKTHGWSSKFCRPSQAAPAATERPVPLVLGCLGH